MTLKQQVYDLLKEKTLDAYEIAEELGMVVSSVQDSCRHLEIERKIKVTKVLKFSRKVYAVNTDPDPVNEFKNLNSRAW